MKIFYIIFETPNKDTYLIPTTKRFYRIEIKAVSFGMAEKKFKKQTLNKFKDAKQRTIHEIKLKNS